MPSAGAVLGAQPTCDNNYSGHMLGLDRARQGHLLYFLDLSESDQFQILFQDRCAQRPKISRIVILSVHKITDIGILRMIIDLGLERDVTAYFQVLETPPERQQWIRQMIQRAKMKDDIEFAGMAECFRAGQLKLTRYARQRSEKTRGLDIMWDHVHPCSRKLIFQRGMDRVVTGVATDVQQTAACEFPEWDCQRGVPEFSQGPFRKWRTPGAIECRNSIIEVESVAPRLPKPQLFLQRLGRERRVQREKIVFHCNLPKVWREEDSSTTILFLQRNCVTRDGTSRSHASRFASPRLRD